jgi:hypothetical protein
MAMFGSGMGLFGGGASGGKIDWTQRIGAMLQDMGAVYDGRQGRALPMLAYQQQRLGDQKKYQEALGALSAPGTASVTNPTLTPGPQAPGNLPQIGPNREIMPRDVAPGPMQITDPGSMNSTPAGPLAGSQFAQMLPFLQNMDPEQGMGMMFNAMQGEQQNQREDQRYQQGRTDQSRRPATAEEKKAYGLDAMTPAEIDGRGNITPISDPRAITPYQEKALANDSEGRKLQWAQFGETRRHNTASEASSGRGAAPSGYRARSDGSLEFIPGGPADPAVAGRGTGKPTEDQAKNSQLYTRANAQLPVALKNFGELAKGKNQFFAGVGEARVPFTGIGIPKGWVTGSEYQQAEGAIKDIAASYLYSVSGATATPGEIAGTVERIMPKMGESADAVAEKKKRLTDMVNSIKLRASPQVLSQAATDNPPPGKLSPEEQSELASLRARFKGR